MTKSIKKSVSKEASKPVGPAPSSQGSSLETVKMLLSASQEALEGINTQFIKDLTSEYYILELEFEEYKSSKESQIKRLGSLL